MEDDEDATYRTLRSHREVIMKHIRRYDGRVANTAGDAVLADFVSVVDNVKCAVEIQQELRYRNSDLVEDRRLHFRIGIHIGDVVEQEDGDLFGSGVNIAARVEAIANPGGICVTRTAYNQVKRMLALECEYIGEHTVKNIAEPIHVYRIITGNIPGEGTIDVTQAAAKLKGLRSLSVMVAALSTIAAIVAAAWIFANRPASQLADIQPIGQVTPSFPEKPSIAVLPFDNMSGDPDKEHLSNGMTEELISRLSKNSSLAVISRNSTFVYRGKPVSVGQIRQDLQVTHVLEGSIRIDGSRIRVTAQLIDAVTDRHLWSETYERQLRDIFAVQSEIAQQIAAALRVEYRGAELERVRHIPTEGLSAYDSFWKGLACLGQTEEANAQSKRFFERAIELEPKFAVAYAWLGKSYWLDYVMGWDLLPEAIAKASELAQKAITLDDGISAAHRLMAYVYVSRNEYRQAYAKAERALALDPNDADAYLSMGEILTELGEPEKGIASLVKARQLNPRHGAVYLTALARAYRKAGQYGEAISVLNEALAHYPDWMLTYKELSKNYRFTGRHADAIAILRSSLLKEPSDLGVNLEITRCYLDMWKAQQSQDPMTLNHAVEIARRAVSFNESYFPIRISLSLILLHKKEYDEAISEAEKAIAVIPERAEGYAAMGEILLHG